METASTLSLTVWRNSEDRWGTRYTLPWARLARRLLAHTEGTKDGTAFSCATFKGPRGTESLAARTLVALDIEQHKDTGEIPPDPRDVVDVLKARAMAAAVYTSFSHTRHLPRYRIVAPLDRPIDLKPLERGVDRLISGNFAMAIMRELVGVVDKSKWGAASIFFLPRHPPGSGDYYTAEVEGDPVPANTLLQAAILGNDRRAMAEAQKAAIRAASIYSEADRRLIDQYNADHRVEDCLADYGYRRAGTRWKSPNQHASSAGAVVVFRDENRWVSHSDSDRSAGVGLWSEDGGCCTGAPFDLFMFYECGNNFRAALKRLREIYPGG